MYLQSLCEQALFNQEMEKAKYQRKNNPVKRYTKPQEYAPPQPPQTSSHLPKKKMVSFFQVSLVNDLPSVLVQEELPAPLCSPKTIISWYGDHNGQITLEHAETSNSPHKMGKPLPRAVSCLLVKPKRSHNLII
ncbi:hypothetical protein TNIN_183111 [Trichonephila inaurata madagascariensis]|uniref:Uncharacterized protein n=1 Tax=Trichonephila inaurata madagascariensis TaxID=2747483 RepID=A0A8X6JWE2_9ARAC|nr:hypothetical protein TNIN_183111 [Trichonephila inaurata madagascariensis]